MCEVETGKKDWVPTWTDKERDENKAAIECEHTFVHVQRWYAHAVAACGAALPCVRCLVDCQCCRQRQTGGIQGAVQKQLGLWKQGPASSTS